MARRRIAAETKAQALAALAAHHSPLEIARRCGVTRMTVYRWRRAQGRDSSRTPAVGRAPARTGGAVPRLRRAASWLLAYLVGHVPPLEEREGTRLWSFAAIARVLTPHCGRVHPATVARYFRAWGFAPRALVRARQAASRSTASRWMREELPRLRQWAATATNWAQCEVLWEVEAALADAPRARRGRGTPDATKPSYWVLAAVTRLGRARFLISRGPVDRRAYVRFVHGLLPRQCGHGVALVASPREAPVSAAAFRALDLPRLRRRFHFEVPETDPV